MHLLVCSKRTPFPSQPDFRAKLCQFACPWRRMLLKALQGRSVSQLRVFPGPGWRGFPAFNRVGLEAPGLPEGVRTANSGLTGLTGCLASVSKVVWFQRPGLGSLGVQLSGRWIPCCWPFGLIRCVAIASAAAGGCNSLATGSPLIVASQASQLTWQTSPAAQDPMLLASWVSQVA